MSTAQSLSPASGLLARLAGFRVLVVPGLHGSDPGHWQSRWERLYPAFERVEQACWDEPDLPRWSHRLGQVLAGSQRPTLIVAHSFGCLTTVHRAAALQAESGSGLPIVGALLVAPADPDKFGLADVLSHRLPFASLLVASDNDPWMSADSARRWAAVWGSELISVGALGHINADSGLGDWLAGQQYLLALATRLACHAA